MAEKKRAKCVVLKGETVEQVFKIARTSLASNEFKILSEDLSQGILIGNHGMTWTYWNAVVGVYMTKIAEGVQVDVLAVSDADPRPIRLNKFDWNEKILKSIVSQSSSDSQACSK